MAVYNGEGFLQSSLESVWAQTFSDFEFIVVEDASSDTTPEILHAIRDPRLKIISNEQNLGLTRSLNVGLKHCRGTYIARLDADDLCAPERLACQVAFLEAHPEVGLLGSAFDRVQPHTGGRVTEREPQGETEMRWWIHFGNIFAHSSVMFRKSLVEQGGYDEAFRYAQDFALWSSFAPRTRWAKLDQPLVSLIEHPGQISDRRKSEQQHCSEVISLRNIENRLGEPITGRQRQTMVETFPACPLPATPSSLEGGALLLRLFEKFLLDPRINRAEAQGLRRTWLLRFLNSWTLRDWRQAKKNGLVAAAFRAAPFTVIWYAGLRLLWAALERLHIRYKK